MALYTVEVINYNGEDVVTKGLNLEGAKNKVLRNIYGYDHGEKYVIDTIKSRAASEKGATLFCADNTAQVNIKLQA